MPQSTCAAEAARDRGCVPRSRTTTMRASRLVPLMCLLAAPLGAQGTPPARDTTARADTARADTVRTIKAITVTAPRSRETPVSALQRLTLPAIATVTAARAQETVNLVDAEDAVKYLPSVFIRKRNYGDTQSTMATRTWGVSSSARSLVFA